MDDFIVIMGCMELFSNNSTVTGISTYPDTGDRDLDGWFSVCL